MNFCYSRKVSLIFINRILLMSIVVFVSPKFVQFTHKTRNDIYGGLFHRREGN